MSEDLLNALADLSVTYVGIKDGDSLVEEFRQVVTGRSTHQAWCMDFVQYCLKRIGLQFKADISLKKTELVMAAWDAAPLRTKYLAPSKGLIAIWQKQDTIQGHCGIVQNVDLNNGTFETVEGNTSGNQTVDREGDGVYLKTRHLHPVGILELRGFLDPFG